MEAQITRQAADIIGCQNWRVGATGCGESAACRLQKLAKLLMNKLTTQQKNCLTNLWAPHLTKKTRPFCFTDLAALNLKCSLAHAARAVCACKHRRFVWVQALRLPATCLGGNFLTNECCHCYWLGIQALFRSTLAGTARAVCACKHRRFVWVQALRLPATCLGGYFFTNECCHCYWLGIQALFRSTLAGTARAVCACKHRRFVWVQALRLPATCTGGNFLTNECCHCYWLGIQALFGSTLAGTARAVCACKHCGLVWVQALRLPATCTAGNFLTNECCHCYWLGIQALFRSTLAGTARAVCACKHRRFVWVQALRLPATCLGGNFLTNECCHCYWLGIQALFRSTLAGTARAVCACKHRRFVWVQALRLPAARSCCTACCAFSRCLGLTYFFAQETNTFFPHKAMSKMQSRVPGPPQNP